MVTVRPSRPTHARSETRAADAAPHTVRDGRCRAVAGAGDRRERGDLLSVRPAPARGAARERAGAAREPRRAGPEVRLDLVQQRRELRQRLQLPDVPGPGARADRVRGPGRAPLVRREPRLAWPDAERLRDAGVRLVLPRAGAPAGTGPPAGAGGRRGGGRASRGRAEPRVLADAAGRRPERAERDDRRERD